MKWYYLTIILLTVLLLGSLIPSRPNLVDLERFFVYPNNKPLLQSHPEKIKPIIESFGFNDDQSAYIELVVSGLNDCNPVIGSGDGKRDMFDFSNRFITEQIETSNDIQVFSRQSGLCR